MAKRTVIKDQQAENRLLLRRILVAASMMFLLMLALVARMFYLQVVSYDHYAMLSQENRVKLVAVPPIRGLIYDRNGILLAENRPSFRLVLTPEEVKDVKGTLARLRGIIELSDADITRFNELLARSRRFEEVPLKFRLTEEELARLAVDRHRFPGVEVKAELTRHYPWGELASHAVGYVGRINTRELQTLEDSGKLADYRGTSHIGKSGIEQYYEDLLHGTVGVEKVETNALGRVIRTLERQPPIPGKDIYLSLDARVQAAAEAALSDYNGAVVAMVPATGEVLAFVSKPTFDPNPFVNGIELKAYQALQNNRNRPLFNRALYGEYPPGSTVKPFVGLAALQTGTVTANETVFCPGFYTLPGVDHRYRDWKKQGHGRVDFYEGIVQSCDVYFYDVAYRMGIDDLSRILKSFGLGARTGIDLIGERSGLVPSREWKRASRNQPWYHGETLITGIGQGFMLATPLQLAEATATLASRGQRVVPRLLMATRDPAGETLTPLPTKAAGAPVELRSPQLWDDAIEAMRRVIHSPTGTARAIGAGIDFQIAGKTGTAQVVGIAQDAKYDASKLAREHHDHGLFIAFAPVHAPEIAIAVIAENGGSGGGVAAPIARKVIDAYMESKQRHAK